MKISLAKKLSLGFILTAVISILTAVLISNYMVSKKFNNYLVDEHKTKINNLTVIINGLYDEETGFSKSSKDEISRYADAEALFIQIKNSKEEIIFTTGSNNLKNNSKMGPMMGSMMKNFSGIDLGEYIEEKYPLTANNTSSGTVTFGYYGTSYLNSGALTFKTALNQSFFLSVFIALIFGLIISIFLSRQISSPLTKITDTANKLQNGDLEARSGIVSRTKEIDDLHNSVNYLAETLQKQELLRKRLTSDMAHELRTPLTNLKTHIEALLDKVWEPTDSMFESFYEEIERLIKLVEGLGDIAKLEQTTLNLNKSRFNLSSELKKITTYFEPLFDNQNCKIYSNLYPDIEVLMDKDKITQVMYNLLSNSLKYLKINGEAFVSLKSDEDKVIIAVKDNGIGISKEDLPFIFERFYRSDESRNKNTGGSGIGLTIVKAIVEAHEGTISVESTLGKGSTFMIILPMDISKRIKNRD